MNVFILYPCKLKITAMKNKQKTKPMSDNELQKVKS